MIKTPPGLRLRRGSDYNRTVVDLSKALQRKRRPSNRRRSARSTGLWTERSAKSLRILQVSALNRIPWLIHGFSTRPGGVSGLAGERVLNLGFTEWDTKQNVLENRRRLQRGLDAQDSALVALKQLHSDVVQVFDAAPDQPCRGDASATDSPGLLLSVQTADCVPILLVHPKTRAVAAVHAGWRGTLRRIAAKAVGKMSMTFSVKPEDLLAAIGPAIGGCCYEVGPEVAVEFQSQFSNAWEWFDELRTGAEPDPLVWLNRAPPGHQPPPKNVFLDLRKANYSQLLESGLLEGNIFVSDLCTACRRDLLFSYRKEGSRSGRLMAVVGIRIL